MPLVAQKVRFVGGSNVQVAAVILVAQSVMIPVAILAGLLGPRWGHKRVLSVAFIVLPVRILLYAFANEAGELVALQALDGIGAGIFDVTSIAICGKSAQGRGHFAGLMGVLGAAIGVGGVAGPFLSGLVVQYCGFAAAFGVFSGIAAVAAVIFIAGMPAD
jgi:MFS family permease